MSGEIKSNFFEIINSHKQLIKINKDKIPKHLLGDFYDDTIEQLKINWYKGDLLLIKYHILLDDVGKFINRYDIDISRIKKSTINKISEHCRLNALKKAAFSEPEDSDEEIEDDEAFADNIKEQYRLIQLKKAELNNETDDDSDEEIEDDQTCANNMKEQYSIKKIELKNNKSNNSTSYNLFKNIIDISQKAITSNNNETMNNTLKALQILMNNEINNTPQVNNTSQVNNIKPSLYEDVRKSQSFINLEKKITNEESFKYAYTLFKYKEMGNNRNRKKIIK